MGSAGLRPRTSIESPVEGSVGVGFAVPINIAKQQLTQLEAGATLEQGYLGISVQETTNPSQSGVAVAAVENGTGAAGGDQWGPADDQAVLDAIDTALDAGISFFDTADIYGSGNSEELLRQAVRGRRDRFIVVTKIG